LKCIYNRCDYMQRALPRCPTGVPGFDEITEGGFIRGSLVLIAGHTGTGKSTFAAKFIYEGAKRWDEKGIYILLNEPKEMFFKFMKSFGIDLKTLEDEGKAIFIDVPSSTDIRTYREVLKSLYELIEKYNVRRLVIDSISSISPLLKEGELRAYLRNTLASLGKMFGVTTILIVDMPRGVTKMGVGVEEFIADAIILFRLRPYRRGRASRWISIVKMRGQPTITTNYELILTGDGPEVIVPPKLEDIKHEFTEKIPLGVKYLDEILKGGIRKGTVTVIAGTTGSGKTLLLLNIASHNALKGRRILYVSLEEPITQLRLALRLLGVKYHDMENNLILKPLSIEMHTLGSLYVLFRDLIRRNNVNIVMLDSLSTFSRYFNLRELRELMKYLAVFSRAYGVTFFSSLLIEQTKEFKTMISTIADNYMVLYSRIINNKLMRFLRFIKLRAEVTPSETFVVDLIPGKGFEVRPYVSR